MSTCIFALSISFIFLRLICFKSALQSSCFVALILLFLQIGIESRYNYTLIKLVMSDEERSIASDVQGSVHGEQKDISNADQISLLNSSNDVALKRQSDNCLDSKTNTLIPGFLNSNLRHYLGGTSVPILKFITPIDVIHITY